MKLFWKATIFHAFCLSTLITQNLFAQTKSQSVQRWEYTTKYLCDDTFEKRATKDSTLEELGETGWELVAVSRENRNSNGSDYSNDCGYFYFKRLRTNNVAGGLQQKTPLNNEKVPDTCPNLLTNTVKIRGLYIGVKFDEVIGLFNISATQLPKPQSYEEPDRAIGITNLFLDSTKFPQIKTQFNEASYLGFNFIENQLVRLTINYRTDITWSLEDWVNKIAEAFNLPRFDSGKWKMNYEANTRVSTFRCSKISFEARLNGDNDTSPSFSLTIPNFLQELQKRRASIEEKKRQAFKINP